MLPRRRGLVARCDRSRRYSAPERGRLQRCESAKHRAQHRVAPFGGSLHSLPVTDANEQSAPGPHLTSARGIFVRSAP